MDEFFLSGAATATTVGLGIGAGLMVVMAFMMRDQPSLKGPVLAVVFAVACGAGAWYVHGATGDAKVVAAEERLDYLKEKYGQKVRPTPEVVNLEVPSKWRIGKTFRSCHLVNADLSVEDPVVMCASKDGKFWELPTVEGWGAP